MSKPPLPRLLFLSGNSKITALVSLSIQTRSRGIFPTSFGEAFRCAAHALLSEPDGLLDLDHVHNNKAVLIGAQSVTISQLSRSIQYHLDQEFPHATAFLLLNRIREEAEFFNCFIVEDANGPNLAEAEILALEVVNAKLFSPEEIGVLSISTGEPSAIGCKNILPQNELRLHIRNANEVIPTDDIPYELPASPLVTIRRPQRTSL